MNTCNTCTSSTCVNGHGLTMKCCDICRKPLNGPAFCCNPCNFTVCSCCVSLHNSCSTFSNFMKCQPTEKTCTTPCCTKCKTPTCLCKVDTMKRKPTPCTECKKTNFDTCYSCPTCETDTCETCGKCNMEKMKGTGECMTMMGGKSMNSGCNK